MREVKSPPALNEWNYFGLDPGFDSSPEVT
jgi:hypothetical protein